MRTYILLVGPIATPTFMIAAELTGTIRGKVVNERGVPVSDARVNAEPRDGKPRAEAMRFVRTDRTGRFSITGLGWGSFKVFATREEAGYPETNFGFYRNGRPSIVTLTPRHHSASIKVKVAKAGILTGKVTDASDGRPVNAAFDMHQVKEPTNFLIKSQPTDYRLLLPPFTPVTLEVRAAGYEPWRHAGSLMLRSGQEMKLDIRLAPTAPKQPSGGYERH